MRYLSSVRESLFSVGHEDGRGDGAEGEYNQLYFKNPGIEFVVLVSSSLSLSFKR